MLLRFYLVKLVDAHDPAVGQHHSSPLHDESSGAGVPEHGGSQTGRAAALTGGVDLQGTELRFRISVRGLHRICRSDDNQLRITYPDGRASLNKLQQLRLGCAGIAQHQQVDVTSTSETIRQPAEQETKALLGKSGTFTIKVAVYVLRLKLTSFLNLQTADR